MLEYPAGDKQVNKTEEYNMAEQWLKVTDDGDMDDEDVVCVDHEGTRIAVFHIDGEYFAIDDMCTHEDALLSEGYIDGTTVECPLHQGVFCLRTGKALVAPAERDVRSMPIKCEDGVVYVKVQQS